MRNTLLTPDVAIVGAGTAGLAAFKAVRDLGREPLLIEHGPYGTTCARVGCMPSKLLLAAANAAHDLTLLDEFGIHLDAPPRIAGADVLARVRRERDRFAGHVVAQTEHFPAAQRLRGTARFVDDLVLHIGDAVEVRPRAIVLATGSRAVVPDLFRQLGDRLATSDDVFEWTEIPARVAVIGTGAIALELGQALDRLGAKVHMFGRQGKLGALTDPAVRDYARATFQRELKLDADAEIVDARRDGDAAVLSYRLDGASTVLTGRYDQVLLAIGRRPTLDALALEHTALARDHHGVPRFHPGTLQCGMQPVFLAGDANGVRPWLNDAAAEGRVAGMNAARFPSLEPEQCRPVLSIIFCEPQIAQVGSRFADLKPDSFVIGEVSFEDQGRSRIMQKNQGLLRLYASRTTGKLEGAEAFGPAIEHLTHLLAWSAQQGLTVQDMVEMPFYHPVIEEGLRTALRDAVRQLADLLPGIRQDIPDAVGT